MSNMVAFVVLCFKRIWSKLLWRPWCKSEPCGRGWDKTTFITTKTHRLPKEHKRTNRPGFQLLIPIFFFCFDLFVLWIRITKMLTLVYLLACLPRESLTQQCKMFNHFWLVFFFNHLKIVKFYNFIPVKRRKINKMVQKTTNRFTRFWLVCSWGFWFPHQKHGHGQSFRRPGKGVHQEPVWLSNRSKIDGPLEKKSESLKKKKKKTSKRKNAIQVWTTIQPFNFFVEIHLELVGLVNGKIWCLKRGPSNLLSFPARFSSTQIGTIGLELPPLMRQQKHAETIYIYAQSGCCGKLEASEPVLFWLAASDGRSLKQQIIGHKVYLEFRPTTFQNLRWKSAPERLEIAKELWEPRQGQKQQPQAGNLLTVSRNIMGYAGCASYQFVGISNVPRSSSNLDLIKFRISEVFTQVMIFSNKIFSTFPCLPHQMSLIEILQETRTGALGVRSDSGAPIGRNPRRSRRADPWRTKCRPSSRDRTSRTSWRTFRKKTSQLLK